MTKKNVLFVGPYHQSDGWGNAAKEYVRALRLSRHNVAVRPIYLNSQTTYSKFDEFEDLENNRFTPDVVIQNCLPNMFRRYGGVKNIGLSFFETSTIANTPWPLSINLMDNMWVSSHFERKTLLRSGCDKPVIQHVPIPTDGEKYKKEYSYDKLGKEHEFKFYFIGEFVTRKDINSVLLAFHREFHPSEQVRLVLKLNRVGADEATLLYEANQAITSFKHMLRLHPHPSMYKQEVIIPVYLSQDDLYGLHNACDSFVMPSSGEAFCIPAFDALMFGNDPIVNKNSSMVEYLKNVNGRLIDSTEVPAIAPDRPLPYLYTGKDSWYQVDVLSLQQRMREVFDDREAYKAQRNYRKQTAMSKVMPHYTYQAIASRINSIL